MIIMIVRRMILVMIISLSLSIYIYIYICREIYTYIHVYRGSRPPSTTGRWEARRARPLSGRLGHQHFNMYIYIYICTYIYICIHI